MNPNEKDYAYYSTLSNERLLEAAYPYADDSEEWLAFACKYPANAILLTRGQGTLIAVMEAKA